METKQSSKIIYEGKIIKVLIDQVKIEHTGYTTSREVVLHPKGVGILAMIEDDILLISQYRYVMGKNLYEIPAGKVEQDEDLEIAAHRELEEETGYQCRKLHRIGSMLPSPGFLTEEVILYEAQGLTLQEHPLAMDDDEFITLHRIPLIKAYDMILSGEIQDAKTIIAIQHAMLSRG